MNWRDRRPNSRLLGVLGLSLVLLAFPLYFADATILEGVHGAIASILAQVGIILVRLGGNLVVYLSELIISIVQYNGFLDSPVVNKGWVILRDVANMFFIVILLFIAFASVLNVQAYSYKKYLSQIIIWAILINFSRLIAGFLIDISQVVMLTFVSAFKDAASGNMANALGLEQLLEIANTGETVTDYEAAVISILFALVFVIIAVAVLAIFFVILLLRIIFLWILIVTAPLAWMGNAIPKFGEKFASQWWSQFTGYLIIGPLLAFFLWLALIVAQETNRAEINSEFNNGNYFQEAFLSDSGAEAIAAANAQAGVNPSDSTASDFITEFSQKTNFISYAVTISLLLVGLTTAQSLGVAGSSLAGNLASGIQNNIQAPFKKASEYLTTLRTQGARMAVGASKKLPGLLAGKVGEGIARVGTARALSKGKITADEREKIIANRKLQASKLAGAAAIVPALLTGTQYLDQFLKKGGGLEKGIDRQAKKDEAEVIQEMQGLGKTVAKIPGLEKFGAGLNRWVTGDEAFNPADKLAKENYDKEISDLQDIIGAKDLDEEELKIQLYQSIEDGHDDKFEAYLKTAKDRGYSDLVAQSLKEKEAKKILEGDLQVSDAQVSAAAANIKAEAFGEVNTDAKDSARQVAEKKVLGWESGDDDGARANKTAKAMGFKDLGTMNAALEQEIIDERYNGSREAYEADMNEAERAEMVAKRSEKKREEYYAEAVIPETTRQLRKQEAKASKNFDLNNYGDVALNAAKAAGFASVAAWVAALAKQQAKEGGRQLENLQSEEKKAYQKEKFDEYLKTLGKKEATKAAEANRRDNLIQQELRQVDRVAIRENLVQTFGGNLQAAAQERLEEKADEKGVYNGQAVYVDEYDGDGATGRKVLNTNLLKQEVDAMVQERAQAQAEEKADAQIKSRVSDANDQAAKNIASKIGDKIGEVMVGKNALIQNDLVEVLKKYAPTDVIPKETQAALKSLADEKKLQKGQLAQLKVEEEEVQKLKDMNEKLETLVSQRDAKENKYKEEFQKRVEGIANKGELSSEDAAYLKSSGLIDDDDIIEDLINAGPIPFQTILGENTTEDKLASVSAKWVQDEIDQAAEELSVQGQKVKTRVTDKQYLNEDGSIKTEDYLSDKIVSRQAAESRLKAIDDRHADIYESKRSKFLQLASEIKAGNIDINAVDSSLLANKKFVVDLQKSLGEAKFKEMYGKLDAAHGKAIWGTLEELSEDALAKHEKALVAAQKSFVDAFNAEIASLATATSEASQRMRQAGISENQIEELKKMKVENPADVAKWNDEITRLLSKKTASGEFLLEGTQRAMQNLVGKVENARGQMAGNVRKTGDVTFLQSLAKGPLLSDMHLAGDGTASFRANADGKFEVHELGELFAMAHRDDVSTGKFSAKDYDADGFANHDVLERLMATPKLAGALFAAFDQFQGRRLSSTGRDFEDELRLQENQKLAKLDPNDPARQRALNGEMGADVGGKSLGDRVDSIQTAIRKIEGAADESGLATARQDLLDEFKAIDDAGIVFTQLGHKVAKGLNKKLAAAITKASEKGIYDLENDSNLEMANISSRLQLAPAQIEREYRVNNPDAVAGLNLGNVTSVAKALAPLTNRLDGLITAIEKENRQANKSESEIRSEVKNALAGYFKAVKPEKMSMKTADLAQDARNYINELNEALAQLNASKFNSALQAFQKQGNSLFSGRAVDLMEKVSETLQSQLRSRDAFYEAYAKQAVKEGKVTRDNGVRDAEITKIMNKMSTDYGLQAGSALYNDLKLKLESVDWSSAKKGERGNKFGQSDLVDDEDRQKFSLLLTRAEGYAKQANSPNSMLNGYVDRLDKLIGMVANLGGNIGKGFDASLFADY